MKFIAKEGQVLIAGYTGIVERKSPTLTSVNIAHKKGETDTEWLSVAFTNPQDGKGQALADFAEKYIQKGKFVAVVANARENGQYTNYYAVRVELGPKPAPKEEQS